MTGRKLQSNKGGDLMAIASFFTGFIIGVAVALAGAFMAISDGKE